MDPPLSGHRSPGSESDPLTVSQASTAFRLPPGVPRVPGEQCAFQGLGREDLQAFGSRFDLVRVRSGEVLFDHGDCDPWVFVLLEGEVTLSAADGRVQRIFAGSPVAEQAISRLKPRRHRATACGTATLMRIDGSRLGYWHSSVDTPIRRWERLADTSYLQRDGAECLRAAAGLEMPEMPAIALKARALIESDDCDAQDVSRLLEEDPTMAAKLIRVANSPLFYGSQVATSCDQAIVRLGLKTTRFLITAFAVRRLFDMDVPDQADLVRELWDHSTEVAAIASVLARRLVAFDPGEAQLAGLLHDVGVIPYLSAAASRPALRRNPEGLVSLICGRRASMGRHVLQSWGFAPSLVTAAAEADCWHRKRNGEADLADLVVVAQLLSFIGKKRILDASSVLGLAAFQKVLGKEMSAGQVMDFLDEFADCIDEVRSLLRS